MTTTERVVEALGGARVLKHVRSAADLRGALRRGLPYRSLETLVQEYEISAKEARDVLSLPGRTLARRKRAARLRPDESDRVFRLARIAAMAEDVLGTHEKAVSWLRHPNRALGGEAPLHRLDTDLGAREVEDVLGRIAYGVHS